MTSDGGVTESVGGGGAAAAAHSSITCSDGSLSTVVRSMTSSDGQTHFSMSGHTGTPDRIAIKNGRGDYVTHMTPQTNFHDNPPRGLFPANT